MSVDMDFKSPPMTPAELADSHISFYLSFGLDLGADEFGNYPQRIIDHKGERYVVERASPTRLQVLGIYEPKGEPADYNTFAFRIPFNLPDIQTEVDRALIDDGGEGVFGWPAHEFKY